MTPDDFRRIALPQPGAVEAGHMGHPDFRADGRVFATLGYPDAAHGMVKLTLEQQEALVEAEPGTYAPVPGGWGRKGATHVRLRRAKAKSLGLALTLAWRNVAPPARPAARPKPSKRRTR